MFPGDPCSSNHQGQLCQGELGALSLVPLSGATRATLGAEVELCWARARFNSFPNMSHVPPTRVLPHRAQEMKKQQAKLVMGRQGTCLWAEGPQILFVF